MIAGPIIRFGVPDIAIFRGVIFAFFTSVAPEGVNIATDITSYLDFVLKLFFAFGILLWPCSGIFIHRVIIFLTV